MPSVYSSACIQLPFPSISDSPAAGLLMPPKRWGFGEEMTYMYIHILGELIVLGLFQTLNSICLLFPPRDSCWPTTPKWSTLLIFSWDGAMADKPKCNKDCTRGKKGAAQSVTTFWYRRSRKVIKFPSVFHLHLNTSLCHIKPQLQREAAMAKRLYFTNTLSKVLLLFYKAFRHSRLTLRHDSVFQVTSAPGNKFSF